MADGHTFATATTYAGPVERETVAVQFGVTIDDDPTPAVVQGTATVLLALNEELYQPGPQMTQIGPEIPDRVNSRYSFADQAATDIADAVWNELQTWPGVTPGDEESIKDGVHEFLKRYAREIANGGDGARLPLSEVDKKYPDLFLRGVMNHQGADYKGVVRRQQVSTSLTDHTTRESSRDGTTTRKLGVAGYVIALPVLAWPEIALKFTKSRSRGTAQDLSGSDSLAAAETHRWSYPTQMQIGFDDDWSKPGNWPFPGSKVVNVATHVQVDAEPGLGTGSDHTVDPPRPVWTDAQPPAAGRAGHLPVNFEVHSLKPVPRLLSTMTGMMRLSKGFFGSLKRPFVGKDATRFDKSGHGLTALESFAGHSARFARFGRTTMWRDKIVVANHNTGGLVGGRDQRGEAELSTTLTDPRIVAKQASRTFTVSSAIESRATRGNEGSNALVAGTEFAAAWVGAKWLFGGFFTEVEAGLAHKTKSGTSESREDSGTTDFTEPGYLVSYDATHNLRTSVRRGWSDFFGFQHTGTQVRASKWITVPTAAKVWVPASEIHKIGTLRAEDLDLLTDDERARYHAERAEATQNTGQPQEIEQPQDTRPTIAGGSGSGRAPESEVERPAGPRRPVHGVGSGRGDVELFDESVVRRLVDRVQVILDGHDLAEQRRQGGWTARRLADIDHAVRRALLFGGTPSDRVADNFAEINKRTVDEFLGPQAATDRGAPALKALLNGGLRVYVPAQTPFGKVEQLVILRGELGEGEYFDTVTGHPSRADRSETKSPSEGSGWELEGSLTPGGIVLLGRRGTPGSAIAGLAVVTGAIDHGNEVSQSTSKQFTDQATTEQRLNRFLHSLTITADVYPYSRAGAYRKWPGRLISGLSPERVTGAWQGNFNLENAVRSTVTEAETVVDGVPNEPITSTPGSLREWQTQQGMQHGMTGADVVARPFAAPALGTVLHRLIVVGDGENPRPELRPDGMRQVVERTGWQRLDIAKALTGEGDRVEIKGGPIRAVTVKADLFDRKLVQVLEAPTVTATQESSVHTETARHHTIGVQGAIDARTMHVADAFLRPVGGVTTGPIELLHGGGETEVKTTTARPATLNPGQGRYLVEVTPVWEIRPQYRNRKKTWGDTLTSGRDRPILLEVDQNGLARLGVPLPPASNAPDAAGTSGLATIEDGTEDQDDDGTAATPKLDDGTQPERPRETREEGLSDDDKDRTPEQVPGLPVTSQGDGFTAVQPYSVTLDESDRTEQTEGTQQADRSTGEALQADVQPSLESPAQGVEPRAADLPVSSAWGWFGGVDRHGAVRWFTSGQVFAKKITGSSGDVVAVTFVAAEPDALPDFLAVAGDPDQMIFDVHGRRDSVELTVDGEPVSVHPVMFARMAFYMGLVTRRGMLFSCDTGLPDGVADVVRAELAKKIPDFELSAPEGPLRFGRVENAAGEIKPTLFIEGSGTFVTIGPSSRKQTAPLVPALAGPEWTVVGELSERAESNTPAVPHVSGPPVASEMYRRVTREGVAEWDVLLPEGGDADPLAKRLRPELTTLSSVDGEGRAHDRPAHWPGDVSAVVSWAREMVRVMGDNQTFAHRIAKAVEIVEVYHGGRAGLPEVFEETSDVDVYAGIVNLVAEQLHRDEGVSDPERDAYRLAVYLRGAFDHLYRRHGVHANPQRAVYESEDDEGVVEYFVRGQAYSRPLDGSDGTPIGVSYISSDRQFKVSEEFAAVPDDELTELLQEYTDVEYHELGSEDILYLRSSGAAADDTFLVDAHGVQGLRAAVLVRPLSAPGWVENAEESHNVEGDVLARLVMDSREFQAFFASGRLRSITLLVCEAAKDVDSGLASLFAKEIQRLHQDVVVYAPSGDMLNHSEFGARTPRIKGGLWVAYGGPSPGENPTISEVLDQMAEWRTKSEGLRAFYATRLPLFSVADRAVSLHETLVTDFHFSGILDLLRAHEQVESGRGAGHADLVWEAALAHLRRTPGLPPLAGVTTAETDLFSREVVREVSLPSAAWELFAVAGPDSTSNVGLRIVPVQWATDRHSGVTDTGVARWFDAEQVWRQEVRSVEEGRPVGVTFVQGEPGALERFVATGGLVETGNAFVFDVHGSVQGFGLSVGGERLSVAPEVFARVLLALGLVGDGRAVLFACDTGFAAVDVVSSVVRMKVPQFELSAPQGRLEYGLVRNQAGVVRPTVRIREGGTWVTVDAQGQRRPGPVAPGLGRPEWTPVPDSWWERVEPEPGTAAPRIPDVLTIVAVGAQVWDVLLPSTLTRFDSGQLRDLMVGLPSVDGEGRPHRWVVTVEAFGRGGLVRAEDVVDAINESGGGQWPNHIELRARHRAEKTMNGRWAPAGSPSRAVVSPRQIRISAVMVAVPVPLPAAPLSAAPPVGRVAAVDQSEQPSLESSQPAPEMQSVAGQVRPQELVGDVPDVPMDTRFVDEQPVAGPSRIGRGRPGLVEPERDDSPVVAEDFSFGPQPMDTGGEEEGLEYASEESGDGVVPGDAGVSLVMDRDEGGRLEYVGGVGVVSGVAGVLGMEPEPGGAASRVPDVLTIVADGDRAWDVLLPAGLGHDGLPSFSVRGLRDQIVERLSVVGDLGEPRGWRLEVSGFGRGAIDRARSFVDALFGDDVPVHIVVQPRSMRVSSLNSRWVGAQSPYREDVAFRQLWLVAAPEVQSVAGHIRFVYEQPMAGLSRISGGGVLRDAGPVVAGDVSFGPQPMDRDDEDRGLEYAGEEGGDGVVPGDAGVLGVEGSSQLPDEVVHGGADVQLYEGLNEGGHRRWFAADYVWREVIRNDGGVVAVSFVQDGGLRSFSDAGRVLSPEGLSVFDVHGDVVGSGVWLTVGVERLWVRPETFARVLMVLGLVTGGRAVLYACNTGGSVVDVMAGAIRSRFPDFQLAAPEGRLEFGWVDNLVHGRRRVVRVVDGGWVSVDFHGGRSRSSGLLPGDGAEWTPVRDLWWERADNGTFVLPTEPPPGASAPEARWAGTNPEPAVQDLLDLYTVPDLLAKAGFDPQSAARIVDKVSDEFRTHGQDDALVLVGRLTGALELLAEYGRQGELDVALQIWRMVADGHEGAAMAYLATAQAGQLREGELEADGDSKTGGRSVQDARHFPVGVLRAKVSWSERDLIDLADRVADPGSVDPQLCVWQLEQVRDGLYPGGVWAGVSLDDSVVGVGGVRGRVVPGAEWTVVKDFASMEAALGAGEVGFSVLVLWQRPGGVGHALVGHRSSDRGVVWVDPQREKGRRVVGTYTLPHQVLIRAVLLDSLGRVVRDGPASVAESGSQVAAVTDPAPDDYGALGLEQEIVHWVALAKEPAVAHGLKLVELPGILDILLEDRTVYLTEDKRAFESRQDAEAAGFTLPPENNRLIFIIEIVTKPMGVLPDDIGRANLDTVLLAVEDVRRRLYRAGRDSTECSAIENVFPESAGFKISDEGRGAVVGGSEQSEHGRSSYTQFTVGVPVNGLYEFLRTANAATSLPMSQDSLRRGLELAAEIADVFVGQYLGDATQIMGTAVNGLAEVDALRGYIALAYVHAAAPVLYAHGPDANLSVVKNYIPTASRTPFAAIRKQLPHGVRAFLENNRDDLLAMFEARFNEAIAPAETEFGVLHTALAVENRLVVELLDTVLLGHAALKARHLRAVSMYEAVGMEQHFDKLDTNNGAIEHPLILIELRHIALGAVPYFQLRRMVLQVSEWEKEAYAWAESVQRLSGAGSVGKIIADRTVQSVAPLMDLVVRLRQVPIRASGSDPVAVVLQDLVRLAVMGEANGTAVRRIQQLWTMASELVRENGHWPEGSYPSRVLGTAEAVIRTLRQDVQLASLVNAVLSGEVELDGNDVPGNASHEDLSVRQVVDWRDDLVRRGRSFGPTVDAVAVAVAGDIVRRGRAAMAEEENEARELVFAGTTQDGARREFDAGRVWQREVRSADGVVAVTFVQDGALDRFVDSGGNELVPGRSLYDVHADGQGFRLTVDGEQLAVSSETMARVLLELDLVSDGQAVLFACDTGFGAVDVVSGVVRATFPEFELSAPQGKLGYGTVVNHAEVRRQAVRVLNGGGWITVDRHGNRLDSPGMFPQDGPEWTPDPESWAVRPTEFRGLNGRGRMVDFAGDDVQVRALYDPADPTQVVGVSFADVDEGTEDWMSEPTRHTTALYHGEQTDADNWRTQALTVPSPWSMPGQGRPFYLDMHSLNEGFSHGRLATVMLTDGDELYINGLTVAALIRETIPFTRTQGALQSVTMLVCDAAALGHTAGGLAFDIWTEMRAQHPGVVVFAATTTLSVWDDLYDNGAPATEIRQGGQWIGFGAPAPGDMPTVQDVLDQLEVWRAKDPRLRAHYAATIPLFSVTDRVDTAITGLIGPLVRDQVLDLLSVRSILEFGLGDSDLVKTAVLRVLRDNLNLPEPSVVILASYDQPNDLTLPVSAYTMAEIGEEQESDDMLVRASFRWRRPNPSAEVQDLLAQLGLTAPLLNRLDARTAARAVDIVEHVLASRGWDAAMAAALALGSRALGQG